MAKQGQKRKDLSDTNTCFDLLEHSYNTCFDIYHYELC